MSSAGVRLRPTTNTRPSISTAITSASHSASSTILLATRRDAVHVARPARSGHQHPGAGDVVGLPGVDQRRQQGALLVAQRQVEEPARPAPATRRAARRTPAPRRPAAWSTRTSAIPCPRGCPGPARSPRPASARCPARRGSPPSWYRARRRRWSPRGRPTPARSPPWWSNSTVSTPGRRTTSASSPRRSIDAVSTTIARVTPDRSQRAASTRSSSPSCSATNSRTLRLSPPCSTTCAPGYSRRAASIDPSASKSVAWWAMMISVGRIPRPAYARAIASISTRAPAGSAATCTVERAGGSLVKYWA